MGLGEEGYCQLWWNFIVGEEKWFVIVLCCSVLVCNYAVILKHTDTLINLLCMCMQLFLGAACCSESQIFQLLSL